MVSVGRIIAGKYCLLQQLGHGAMGSVWAAEHLALRSQVAVKLIQQGALGLPHIPHRFEREARALAALRSPHVVQVLDYGVDSGTQYLVMELLNGETLRARLTARGRLQAGEVGAIARQVGRAVSVSHAAGFVHRDLKPENVFLTSDGDELIVKVLDFGITKTLASEATNLTDAGVMLGTCHYMSPEQARGGRVDPRSDLWSLGVIVFECLTGSLPFRADSMFAAVSAICTAPIVVPSEVARVPAGFDAWFARAVCRDLEQRFQSAGELAEALRLVLGASQEWVGNDAVSREQGSERDTHRIDAFPSSAAGERRGEVRIPSSIPAAIDGQRDFPNTALVYNASRSGALLTTQRSWDPEQELELKLHLDSPTDGELISARVVRVSRRDDPFWKFEVAVRFADLLPEELVARIEAKARGRAPL
jgi:serine/threonine protein kinase